MIPILDIYLTLDSRSASNPVLQRKGTGTSGRAPVVTLRDVIKVRLWFYQTGADASGSTLETVRMNTETFAIGAKDSAALTSNTVLFYSDTFVEGGNGSTGWYYETILDLRENALITAFGTKKVLSVTIDVEVQNVAGLNYTLQFETSVRRDALSGAEGLPSNPIPAYPLVPTDGTVLGGGIVGGLLQWVKLSTAQLWARFIANEALTFPWARITEAPAFVEEAPADGKLYGRKDGEWSEVPGAAIDCTDAERLAGGTFDTLIVSGAGTAAVNGVYTRTSATRWDGQNDFSIRRPDGDPNYRIFLAETPVYYFSGFLIGQWEENDGGAEPRPTVSVAAPFQPGQVVRVTDQGNRIEQFLGGDASDNANWVVLEGSRLQTQTLTTGLVAHYGFDEDANDAVGSRHLTESADPSQAVVYSAGKIGTAAVFADSYFLVGGHWPISPGNPFTVNLWAKANAADGDLRFVTAYGGGAFAIDKIGNEVIAALRLEFGSFAVAWSRVNPWDGTWKMITGIYDGAKIALWVDGVLLDSVAVESASIEADSWLTTDAVAAQDGGFGAGPKTIDSLSIWSRALSGAEISALFNGGDGRHYSQF